MVFFDLASGNPDHFDDLVVLVNQLRASGVHSAAIDRSNVPQLGRSGQYDVALLVDKIAERQDAQLMLIGAQDINDQKLAALRALKRSSDFKITAVGSMTKQQELMLFAKLRYVSDDTPGIVNLLKQKIRCTERAPIFGVPRTVKRGSGVPKVMVVGLDLTNEATARSVRSLGVSRGFQLSVLTDGKSKSTFQKAYGNSIPVFGYTELLPHHLAKGVDVAAFFGKPSNSYRMQAFVANLVAANCVLLDCTIQGSFSAIYDAFVQAPPDLGHLALELASHVVPNLSLLAKEVSETKSAREFDCKASLDLLGIPSVQPDTVNDQSKSRSATVFLPTNGVGLGHAQRTSLIATKLKGQGGQPRFAAFPSCMKMLTSYGFDVMPLVSRSPVHKQEHENDLINFQRLMSLTAEAKTFVFDGGYVFDSVYRTILENELHACWIRRGLWQSNQDNSVALDREKVFQRVIVPEEAFPELNQTYSQGKHVFNVGPIVQTVQHTPEKRQQLRDSLKATFNIDFDHLVVTMLGGGVAADRRAQTAAVCGSLDSRTDVLNLLVVWPTATVEASAFTWKNTRVVKTHHASALVAASDLFVSAVGYNSFHEALYNQVPTIFLPQMNAFMDDQRARAQAAVERGVAILVEETEMLRLFSEISLCLDGGKRDELKSALAGLELPPPGNSDAAKLIWELSQ